MKKIIFFEKLPDTQSFAPSRESSPEILVVALSPEADYILKRGKVGHVRVDDYYSFQQLTDLSHFAQLNLDDLMKHLDQCLMSHDERFKKNHLRPFYSCGYQFKMFYDNLLIKAMELAAVLRKEHPEVVVYFDHPRYAIDDSLGVHRDESVYGQILSHDLFRRAFPGVRWERRKGRGNPKIWLDSLENLLRQNLKSVLRLAPVDSARVHPGKFQHKILCSHGRNIPLIAGALNDRGAQLVVFDGRDVLKKYSSSDGRRDHWSEFFLKVEGDPVVKGACSCEGYEFFDLMKDRFEYFVFGLERYVALFEQFTNLLAKNKIDLVLQETWSPHIPGNAPLSEAARESGTPRGCWVHGGFCSQGPTWPYIDYRFSDYYLVWGDKMRDIVESSRRDRSLKVKVAGCPYIERIKNSLPPQGLARKGQKVRIVYAVMNFLYNDHYLGWNEPDYRDTVKWEINGRILDVLGEFQDRYDVILKLLPGQTKNELFRMYLKDRGFHRVKIVERGKMLYHLVPETDLFVLDYVSTGFFEAAAGRGDIFIYSRLALPEDAQKIIKTRAFLYDNLSPFLTALREFLIAGQFGRQHRPEDFLEQYLNIRPGVDNLSRTADGLLNIVKQRNEIYAST